jgi:hypothetical protein
MHLLLAQQAYDIHIYTTKKLRSFLMKFATVMSSDFLKHGRWDAEFHILNAAYAERAASISTTMTAEAVIALLSDESSMPTSILKLISSLSRGNNDTKTRDQLLKAVQEYPFLSLAIIKDKGRTLIEAKQKELAQQAQKLSETKSTLDSSSPDIQGLHQIPIGIRSQLNKNRYVAGVVYFDGHTLSIPVETSSTAYVADCWVIELADWTGAEMIDRLVSEGNVPVPRRHEDMGQPVGCVEHLADHTVNYGGIGWR